MKYDLTVTLKDREGTEIRNGDMPIQAFKMVINALDQQLPDEKIEGEEKMRRWALGCKILASNGQPEMELEDAALCKRLVGIMYVPLIVGQIWTALEQKSAA